MNSSENSSAGLSARIEFNSVDYCPNLDGSALLVKPACSADGYMVAFDGLIGGNGFVLISLGTTLAFRGADGTGFILLSYGVFLARGDAGP